MKIRFNGHLKRVNVVEGPDAHRVCMMNQRSEALTNLPECRPMKRASWITRLITAVGLARLFGGRDYEPVRK